ncbi:MAG TPA: ABC transporter permease [Verrucomicrobiae bacterium]|nr:ABC transporter permease [Verrucomicrobiae bacterium]
MSKRISSFFRNLFRKRAVEQALDDELRASVEVLTQEKIKEGISPSLARREALIELGGVEQVKEQTREVRAGHLIETLWQDVRYGARMLRKSPGFTAVAVLTLALGVGATTAIYSVIDATLLHALPYPHPGELVRIEDDLPGVGAQDVSISIPEWKDLENSGIFQYVALEYFNSVNLTGSAQPTRIAMKGVTPNYFAMLGVGAQLGRTFDPGDRTPGLNLEVVISDGLWKGAFGADPRILERTLRLDNDVYHVVGVMPPGFRDQGTTSEERNTELWAAGGFAAVPFPPPLRNSRFGTAFARLKPGLPMASAQAHIDALVASLKKQYPADYPAQAAWNIRLIPLAETLVGNLRESLILLFGAVVLVLLISCVNVVNLLLARASARGREMAVRQALGAPRTRLIRQLLTESLLLFVLGGATGFAVLFGARKFLLQFIPESLPRFNEISISWGVLAFAVVVSVAAGIIFGLAPAWFTSRRNLTATLGQEGRGSSGSRQRSRLRHVLVIGELALSLVLLVAAGLLLRSFWDLFKVPLGFNPTRVMAIETWLPFPNDPKTDMYSTAKQESVLLREVLRRNRTLPGVEETAVGDRAALPLGHGKDDLNTFPLIREGQEEHSSQPPLIDTSIVSPEYFHLLGMTLLRGRPFVDQDLEDTPPVALINQAAARTYWPNQDPVGKRVHVRSRSDKPEWTTIVGVIADARTESLGNAGTPQVYLDIYQRLAKDLVFFLRGQVDPGAISAQVRTQLQAVDSELPVFRAETLDAVLSSSLSVRRFSMDMVALFAATALLLAGLGIYGTISYLVNEQSREIAIRFALGAQKHDILRMVLRQGLILAAAGAGVGLVGALIASHLMASLLFGVSANDLTTFAGVTLVLTAVVLAASYIPALRAMRVDPIVALRCE